MVSVPPQNGYGVSLRGFLEDSSKKPCGSVANFMKNKQSNLAYFSSPYTENWRLLAKLSQSVGKKWLETLGIFSLAVSEVNFGFANSGNPILLGSKDTFFSKMAFQAG